MPRRFNKWTPDRPEGPADPAEARKQALKVFLLRWGWLIATLMAAFGYVIIALALTDNCHRIGLRC